MKKEINIVPIIGRWLTLEPLQESHKNGLGEAMKDPKIWSFQADTSNFEEWWNVALASHTSSKEKVFVVTRSSDKQALGSTRLYDISLGHKRLQIGYTWYSPNVWGTYVNPETKLLLLSYIFEKLNFNRVGFSVDERNTRSRLAMKRLGATEEGILKKHMVLKDGFVRNTISFSITNDAWPSIKEKLLVRLKSMR